MKRKQYDTYGSAGFDAGAGGSGQGYWKGGPTVDPEELFRKIFGEFSSSPFGDFQGVFNQPQEVSISYFLFLFFCLFAFSRAAPAAYGGSQARGRIGAVATGLCQSHSNAGSEPHLQPTPQLTATPDH